MSASHGIPVQKHGGSSDTYHTIECNSKEEAMARYKLARQRLLNVNLWHKLAGTGSAEFALTDDKGEVVKDRQAQIDDLFRIDIPGPGTITGDGYDWVRVEAIEEKEENNGNICTYLKVRPATNPANNDDSIAHFFDDAATSTFVVCCEGSTVIASVHGRNEHPNTETGHLADQARNALVSATAISVLSKIQWKKLLEGLTTK